MKFLIIQASHLEMPSQFGLDSEVLKGALLGKLGKELDIDSKNKLIEEINARVRF